MLDDLEGALAASAAAGLSWTWGWHANALEMMVGEAKPLNLVISRLHHHHNYRAGKIDGELELMPQCCCCCCIAKHHQASHYFNRCTMGSKHFRRSIHSNTYILITTLQVINYSFHRTKPKTKRSFEIVRVIFKKWVECDFIQVLNPLCTVLSNSACSLLFIRSIRDFQGTSSHLQAGILS